MLQITKAVAEFVPQMPESTDTDYWQKRGLLISQFADKVSQGVIEAVAPHLVGEGKDTPWSLSIAYLCEEDLSVCTDEEHDLYFEDCTPLAMLELCKPDPRMAKAPNLDLTWESEKVFHQLLFCDRDQVALFEKHAGGSSFNCYMSYDEATRMIVCWLVARIAEIMAYNLEKFPQLVGISDRLARLLEKE